MAKKSSLPVASAKNPVPVKIVSDTAKDVPSTIDKEREKKWRAEDDMRTMQQAEEIRKDKERMKNMKQMAKQKMAELKKIC